MEIYCGLGHNVPYEEYMQVINEAFGFVNGHPREFTHLLPKLYRPGRRPQDENYVVTEDGKCVAAIGAYSHEIEVCGTRIPCRGIGNVAVLAAYRSKGYMKDCMNMAMRDMVKDGIALSALGGRRQRYRYFSFDRAGTSSHFWINSENIRHTFGADYDAGIEIVKVAAEDEALLESIRALCASGPFVPVRKDADFHDIASSWFGCLYAGIRDGRFVGYCIHEPEAAVSEIMVTDKTEFTDFVIALMQQVGGGSISLSLPPHQRDYIDAVALLAEGYNVNSAMTFSILNYQLVSDAFFRLRATYSVPADGELTLLIHGFAKDELLTFSVKDGVPSVTEAAPGTVPARELSHIEATSLLFAPIDTHRLDLPVCARDWFPLPLWMYRADEV